MQLWCHTCKRNSSPLTQNLPETISFVEPPQCTHDAQPPCGTCQSTNIPCNGPKMPSPYMMQDSCTKEMTLSQPCPYTGCALMFYSFSVFWDTFVYHYTRIMPNFNDVYIDNYQVLDYGLTCKKNPLVLVASGLDAHLSCLSCHFLVIQTCS
jgi:hypothetical protein